MKLTATLLALTFAVSASAQTQATATATAKPATPAAKSATAANLATAAKPAAAVHATPNGPSNIPIVHGVKKQLYALSYIDTLIGSGPLAEPSALGKSQADSKIMWYTVHYTGYLAKDGTKFDSSYDHVPDGNPITFPYGLGKVIPGWDTSFEGMHVGGKRRIFVPYQLAYGPNGRPPVIPAKADLIFDVELIAVSDKPPVQPPPPAPPAQKSPTTPAEPGAPKAPAAPAATPAPAAPAAAAPAKPETK